MAREWLVNNISTVPYERFFCLRRHTNVHEWLTNNHECCAKYYVLYDWKDGSGLDALDKSLMLGHLQASLHGPRSIAIFSVWNLQTTLRLFNRRLNIIHGLFTFHLRSFVLRRRQIYSTYIHKKEINSHLVSCQITIPDFGGFNISRNTHLPKSQ